jgi:hypothetical protein
MTNNEIVENLAKAQVVEKMIEKITSTGAKDPDSLPDLAQDVYLSLLQDGNLQGVYADGENHLRYYITRILMNNICSSTSRYYRTYIWPRTKQTDINGYDKDISE